MKDHNNLWCELNADTVIPDEWGHCSLCGAILHDLTGAEAAHLVDVFEDIALKRVKAERWEALNWLFDEEAHALAIAKKTLLSQTGKYGKRGGEYPSYRCISPGAPSKRSCYRSC